jgi:glucose-6-phosphate 1-dehydrogenase
MTPRQVAERTVRGQYGVGECNGEIVPGYRQEKGVKPSSTTETYVALRAHIDSWRWAGVPFLLRSGKRLAAQVSEIAVRFKRPPMLLFSEIAQREGVAPPEPRSNYLVLRIQPDEGISLSFASKRPGMRMQLDDVTMDFLYDTAFNERSPEAYERLLLDALRGDAALFTRSDEVEYAWRFATSVLAGWAELPAPSFPNYYPFSDGPEEAGHLMPGTAHWRSLTAAARSGGPC